MALQRVPTQEPVHLVVDSTGLSVFGEGEWAAAKHGGRGKRGWKKLHLGVDRSGVIVAEALTDATIDDATTGIGRTIGRIQVLGRRGWKKASGYHRQARVENAIFRYKSIIGPDLRTRSTGGRQTEAVLGCNILNRMTSLGRPMFYRIGR